MAAHIADHLSATRFQTWLADPATIIHVAEVADHIAGYVMICLEPEEETPEVAALLTLRPACEVSKCYVESQAHGSGMASELMNVALNQARSLGARGAWLGVNVDNARAIAFYGNCGFSTIGPRRYEVGGRAHRDYLMQIDLDTVPASYEPTVWL